MKKYKLATRAEAEKYMGRAIEWVDNKGPEFTDVRQCTILVLAEYIANLNGKTLYKHYAKQ